jgi:hypothetical protein
MPSQSSSTTKDNFKTSINIFSMLIVAAFVLKIVFQIVQKLKTGDAAMTATIDNPTGANPNSVSGQADSTIGMYGWSMFWMLSLMVTTIAILLKRYKVDGLNCTLNTLFYVAPFVFIIALIVWSILQTYTYRRQINMNLIPTSYMTWSITSTVNIMLMFGAIYAFVIKMLDCTKVSSDTAGVTGGTNNADEGLLILLAWTALILGALTTGVLIISHVLIACYTTDG